MIPDQAIVEPKEERKFFIFSNEFHAAETWLCFPQPENLHPR
jgi:hypothetical protein